MSLEEGSGWFVPALLIMAACLAGVIVVLIIVALVVYAIRKRQRQFDNDTASLLPAQETANNSNNATPTTEKLYQSDETVNVAVVKRKTSSFEKLEKWCAQHAQHANREQGMQEIFFNNW